MGGDFILLLEGLNDPLCPSVHAELRGQAEGDQQTAQGGRPKQQKGPLGHPVKQQAPQQQDDGNQQSA